jgi:hypothetical protein
MADDPIDAREMIAAYRAVARPSPAVKRRIARVIDAPVRARRWPYVVVAVAAAAAVVAMFGGPESWRDRSPQEEARPEAAYDDATPPQLGRVESPHLPRAVESGRTAGAATQSEATLVGPRDAAERKPSIRRDTASKPRDRAPASAPVQSSEGDDLLAEMALLERARSRLAEGGRTEALALVEQHARTFTRGALAEERDALRVIASCGLPDRAESAWAARLAFARDYPRSTYAERVRRACAELAESSGETDIP